MAVGEQAEFGPESEYHRKYREYDIRQARVMPFKPEAQPVAVDAKMETSTTNRRDYTEKTLERQLPLKPTDNNLKGEGTLDFNSSYNTTFMGHKGERARPIRQDRKREELEKFVGEPTYAAEFREWSLQPRERKQAPEWLPSSAKMADTTTNRADFTQQRGSRREIVKPKEEITRSDEPFQGETGYRETFKEYKVQPRVPRAREEWAPPRAKFNALTTQMNDFTGPYQPKRESCRPDRGAFASNAPFEGDTTSRHDYQQKAMGERYVHKQEEYVRPEGIMDLTTTMNAQFRDLPLDPSNRQTAERPGSSKILRGSGPMEGKSGYNADFVGFSSPRREMLKPKSTYEPSKERFEGQSVQKQDYVVKDIERRQNYRPTWEPLKTEEPFQSSTEHKTSFQQQALPPRRQRATEVYQSPSVPFGGTTTTKSSFTGEFAPKRASFKPERTAETVDAKFQGTTTFGDDFKAHEVSPRQRHQQQPYVQPEGVMDMRTSNMEQYQPHGKVSRHVITKPGSSHAMQGKGKFEGSSSYSGDFIAPPPQQRTLAHAKSDYQPSSEKFDHVPTYKAAFTGSYAPRQESFRPGNRPLQDLNGFEDQPKAPRAPWQNASPQHVPPMSV